jgi:hypothetical protein
MAVNTGLERNALQAYKRTARAAGIAQLIAEKRNGIIYRTEILLITDSVPATTRTK